MHIFYIHGFLSGPNAVKARALQSYVQTNQQALAAFAGEEVKCSGLDFPDTPAEAYATLRHLLSDYSKSHCERIGLVGSSMGGFFSTLLSSEFRVRAVLLNPCVHPQDYFADLIGPQYNEATNRHFELRDDMIEVLRSLDAATVVRSDLLSVYLGGCDEVLDHRKSMLRYNACDINFVAHEDHAFTHDFEAILPKLVSFLIKPELSKD